MASSFKENTKEKGIDQGIHFILKASARELRSQDLLKIIEIAEQVEAVVHVSHKDYQVLLGVPEAHQVMVASALAVLGFEYMRQARGLIEGPTFVLKRKP